MSEIDRFLRDTPWADADRTALAGDASRRRYERLHSAKSGPAILMIAPPAICGSSEPFLNVANHLAACGYSAPRIYASDLSLGHLLLEDLGDDLFAQLAETSGDMEQSLYEAAVDFLADLHKAPLLQGLVPFDAQAMTEAVGLASTWYAQGGTGDPRPDLLEGLADSFRDMPALTEVMILRDFHAENLIWLPDRQGHARVGLLDFQDALLGHRAYDLVSLLRDARRDVPEALEDALIEHYIAASGVEGSAFRLAYATLCVQRNLRILGIFARLSLAEGKTRYLDFIPRVWGHVISGLNHPELANLKQVVLECIPNPSPAHLTRIRPA